MRCFKMLAIGIMTAVCLWGFHETALARTLGSVTDNGVNVRELPELDSNVYFQASAGQSLEVTEDAGEFYEVNIDEYENVYISKQYIRVTETVGTAGRSGAVVFETANADMSELLDVYNTGDEIILTGQSGDWYAIKYESGNETATAYVEKRNIQAEFGDKLPALRNAGADSLAEDIIEFAMQYLGVRYRYGGTDPSTGLDCSGFLMIVMRNFGIQLNRTSAGMASVNGTPVDRSELEKGDLVFFATTSSRTTVSHVGMYIGNGQFIHSSTNQGVVVSNLSESYYNQRYLKANRLLE